MTEARPGRDPLVELHFALAEGHAQQPPRGIDDALVRAALEARAAGRPVDEPAPISAVEAFRRALVSIARLLDSLTTDEWHRPVLRNLDVQQLVGHLIGVERDFDEGRRHPAGAQSRAEHVASTDAVAAAQIGRPPAETLEAWRAATTETLGELATVEDAAGALDVPVSLHGLRLPLGPLLVVRTFELWTHEEDIRRATTRPLQAPDAASLRLMTDLAVAMLPAGMRRVNRSGEGRVARIVLTGAGGGTWQTPLGLSADSSSAVGGVDVRIVADAVDFCRLVANRIDPADLATTVTGDAALARDLFDGAVSLALD